jgi:hypothetical protein
MLQGGDPDGTGRGGESFFGGKIRDEFDERLVRTQHKSQLYIAIERVYSLRTHCAHRGPVCEYLCVSVQAWRRTLCEHNKWHTICCIADMLQQLSVKAP